MSMSVIAGVRKRKSRRIFPTMIHLKVTLIPRNNFPKYYIITNAFILLIDTGSETKTKGLSRDLVSQSF